MRSISAFILLLLIPFYAYTQEGCNCHSCCDGIDNDGDGYVDWEDFDCDNSGPDSCPYCSEETSCSNSADDDDDGDTDNSDSECPPGETACSNGSDDDGDTKVDCDDADCDADHDCCTPSNHVLSASGDGGFENGSSFSANGWTLNNDGATNDWVLGTTPGGYSGSRCAFISKDVGSTYEYDITDETHIDFSRSVDLSGYSGTYAVYLSFDWKGNCDDGCYDFMEVHVNGDPVTNILIAQTGWTTQKVDLTEFAGTTIDLSFHWDCGFSDGNQPPHAVDNIEVYECIPNNVLPVELLSFDGTSTKKGNLLKWRTATEKRNEKFELLRSSDGKNYQKIGTVDGSGTTHSEKSYSLLDKAAPNGASYYRLIQVDRNGKEKNYGPVVVQRKERKSLKVFRIAGSKKLQVEYAPEEVKSRTDLDLRLSIFNSAGQRIRCEHYSEWRGSKSLSLRGAEKGVYFLKLKPMNGQAMVRKFLLSGGR